MEAILQFAWNCGCNLLAPRNSVGSMCKPLWRHSTVFWLRMLYIYIVINKFYPFGSRDMYLPCLQGTTGPIKTGNYWSDLLTPKKFIESMCSWSEFSLRTRLAGRARSAPALRAGELRSLQTTIHKTVIICVKEFVPYF